MGRRGAEVKSRRPGSGLDLREHDDPLVLRHAPPPGRSTVTANIIGSKPGAFFASPMNRMKPVLRLAVPDDVASRGRRERIGPLTTPASRLRVLHHLRRAARSHWAARASGNPTTTPGRITATASTIHPNGRARFGRRPYVGPASARSAARVRRAAPGRRRWRTRGRRRRARPSRAPSACRA